nr:MAG TPA: hypothetical protein [Caudoviricetes sp.]
MIFLCYLFWYYILIRYICIAIIMQNDINIWHVTI